uniref:Uncharacterized protein n=1 Tax=Tanacetum cinerariifolium TaxID=118510 RepID=A0A699IIU9_TANCI|nr:hypothetical protein [Tanacetum cinerariifolium]
MKRSESIAIGADVIMAVEEKTESQGGWGDSCDKKKDDNKPQDEAEGSSEQTTDNGINWDGTRRNEVGTKAGERRKRDEFLKEITMRGQLVDKMMVLD